MTVSIGVIGAGISGLAVAFDLKERLDADGTPHTLAVYEKSGRVGGSIGSERVDGFLLEWGPNGFLNNEPATFTLLKKLGLRDRLSVSEDSARKRYLMNGGKLHQVPLSPPGFLMSGIMPFSAKLRFMMEPFIKTPPLSDDETVADFVTRRFGRSAVENMFDPLMSGIYAGNVNVLSIHSTFKVFSEFEREHGSVVKGMFARIKQRRAEAVRGVKPDDELLTTSKSPMSSKLLSFREGMTELPRALAERLGECVKTSTKIVSLAKVEGGYELTFEGGETVRHDVVIVAVPPRQAVPYLAGLDAELAGILEQIPSSTIAVVSLGFRGEDMASPLDGFGYLIPRKEGIRSLGVLWSSSIFAGRAPEGCKLLTVMIGGAHDPEAIRESDETLVATALRDAEGVLGLRGKPVLTRVVRHETGIPQYVLGHRERLEGIASRLRGLPGLYLAGNGYHGISTNDCIRCAEELVAEIAKNGKNGKNGNDGRNGTVS